MPGLLSRLFGRNATREISPVQTLEVTLYEGHETLEVVGESHYQETLWKIVGGRPPDRIRYETYALLVPDPDNEYDENAIQIRIAGLLVGYLSEDDAAQYHDGLLQLMKKSANHAVALHAVIVGGGERQDGPGFLGVFLDHDPADFGVAQQPSRKGGFRTGLSEAQTTDISDDRYDLSWYAQLSNDDATAVDQLRPLLEDDHDPIDRHYMFCELEHRLYRCRNTAASALDEYDAVCHQHDEEMDAIRPVLLEKFGVIPVIEMYRQATIRCAKAKLWQAARHWAERGISIYGEDAARPEVVEDLRERLARAITKIETADRPRRKPARVSVPPGRVEEPLTESLLCVRCGATFERVVTRGRKPRFCPTCRPVVTDRPYVAPR